MNASPIFRLFSDDPRLPIDLRSLVTENGDDGAEGRFGLDFSFVYRSLPLHGHCVGEGSQGTLSLEGVIGPLPFSAESPQARQALLSIVEAANRHLGQAFRFEEGHIGLIREAGLDMPVFAANLVTAVVSALVPLKPYIEVIETYLVLPGEGEKAGAGKVRPMWLAGRGGARGAGLVRHPG